MENTNTNEQSNLLVQSEPTPGGPDEPRPDNATADQESHSEQAESVLPDESHHEPLQGEPMPIGWPDQPIMDSVTVTPASALVPQKTPSEIRSDGGRDAHFGAQLKAALFGRLIEARRLDKFSNHHIFRDQPLQIRTISGTQSTFTINVDTEPAKVLVLAKDPGEQNDDTRHLVFGVLREDAIRFSKPSGSSGHKTSGHRQVALGQVPKILLGDVYLPRELVSASTAADRLRLLARIDDVATDTGAGLEMGADALVEQFMLGELTTEPGLLHALDRLDFASGILSEVITEETTVHRELVETVLQHLAAARTMLRRLMAASYRVQPLVESQEGHPDA